jgi:hypothetical protein
MSKFITPTVGRIVWLMVTNPQSGLAIKPGEPLAAQIAAVHDVRSIAVGFLDAAGRHHNIESVPLVQDGDSLPGSEFYCVWMPYQMAHATPDKAADGEGEAEADADKASDDKAMAKTATLAPAKKARSR